MRLLLAIAVFAAPLAGPWLCCCGPTQTTAAVAAAPADDADACPHCRAAKVESEQPADPTGPLLPAPCPCGGMMVDAVAGLATGQAVAGSAVLDLPAGDGLLSPTVHSAARPAVAPPGLNPLRFFPAESRLRIHHALRC